MNFNRIVCFDLEMCCWNIDGKGRTGEIIEIGLAEIDLTASQIIRRAQYYVKPENDEISPFCTELTGISGQKIAKQGRPLEAVLSSMVKNFGGPNKIYAAWGHDDQILAQECLAKQLDFPIKEYINLATLFRVKHRHKSGRMGQRRALEIAKIEWEGRQHSGYVDAYNLAKLALTLL